MADDVVKGGGYCGGSANVWAGWYQTNPAAMHEVWTGGTTLQDLANLMMVIGDSQQIGRVLTALEEERRDNG